MFSAVHQARFQEVILEKAELVDQQQSLEHSMLQLEGESSTISELRNLFELHSFMNVFAQLYSWVIVWLCGVG